MLNTYGSPVKLFSWTGTTGPFATNGNWDLATAPNDLTNNRARISNGGTAQITTSRSLSDLYVGDNVGTKVGNITQTAGTLSVGSSFYIGHFGGTGTYDIGGGAIAYSGTDKFQINGNATTAATLNVHNTGTVTSTSGAGVMVVGEGVTYGTSFLPGNGHLIITDTASVAPAASEFWVGDNGSATHGTLDVSGSGTLTLHSWFAIGRTGGNGIVNLSGNGSITKVAGGTGNITFAGTSGVLNQTGGTFSATDSEIFLGELVGTSGTWNFSAGTATINDARVGMSGTGTLAMTGPASLAANYMTVAPNSGGVGTWTLNSGTANVAQNVYAGESGKGVFTIGGTGTLNAGTMTVGNNPSANATVNLNAGGKIATASITRGGASTLAFNMNGGTIQANR